MDARCRPILLSYNPFELAALDANTEMLTDFICHPAFMKSKQNLKEIHISLDIELLGIKGAVALFEKRKHYLYQTEKLITALSSKIDYFNKKNYKDKMLVRKVRDELKAAKEEYEGGILTPELQESFEAACFNVLREARNAEVKQHLQVFRGGIRGLIDSFLKCIGCDAQ